MPEPYARHLEERHSFLSLFRAGVFSARVRLVKPERDIFDHAAQVFGAPPASLLFLDDVAENVAGAQAAGWQALHFVDATQCRAELAARGLL
jgi:putative hydrolase of the HAD superfamily